MIVCVASALDVVLPALSTSGGTIHQEEDLFLALCWDDDESGIVSEEECIVFYLYEYIAYRTIFSLVKNEMDLSFLKRTK